MENLGPLIEQHIDSVKQFRHELHMNPEIKWEEYQTTERIIAQLQGVPGLKIDRVLETGLVATLGAEKSGPCIALRADIDALPIAEQTGKSYASQVEGKMHACGHDGHTACLLGAVKVLSEIQDRLSGPVKFFFQPAEEGGGGGKRLCEAGVLKSPDVDAVFGLHCSPYHRLGTVATKTGPWLASHDRVEIIIRGHAGHAAQPQDCIDPILIGSHIVVALQAIPSRLIGPQEQSVISTTVFQAGSVINIIPESAKLLCSVRNIKPETRQLVLEKIRTISTNIAQSFGGSAEVVVPDDGYPPVVNDKTATEVFVKTAVDAIGVEKVDPDSDYFLFAEDFSFYGHHVPAAFWMLGIVPDGMEISQHPKLHDPKFDFNDDAIALAVKLHCMLALKAGELVR